LNVLQPDTKQTQEVSTIITINYLKGSAPSMAIAARLLILESNSLMSLDNEIDVRIDEAHDDQTG
jgi:hypothetical protein